MRKEIPNDFTAEELENILGCHVTTVELHSLVERGELTCDECCKQCVLPHGKYSEIVESTRPKMENGRPKKESPSEHNARMQLTRALVREGEELYRDKKGMPLTVDRAPCLFNVADEDLFQTWLDAKLAQRDKETKRKKDIAEAVEEPVIN